MPNLKADAKEYPAHMSDIQAAEYLGIAPVTLRKWRADKIGPKYVKFEKTVRYSRKDLDAWLKSRAILTIDCTENVYEK